MIIMIIVGKLLKEGNRTHPVVKYEFQICNTWLMMMMSSESGQCYFDIAIWLGESK